MYDRRLTDASSARAISVRPFTLGKVPAALAVLAAVAVAVAGAIWGTHVAGGPDSYCYLSQAELFASGRVAHEEPLASIAPWEHAADAFIPVGHVPAARQAGASVPMCSPGYPLAMAAVRPVGGRVAMLAVVPVCGAFAVWLTFVLGRRIAGASAGAIAAVLLSASPAFLYQVVQPMSDVPAATAWVAALVAVTRASFSTSVAGAMLGGAVTGIALLVRPNLVPLAGVVALVVFTIRPIVFRKLIRTWAAFGVALLPSIVTVALLQNAMYGGPLNSGYGDLGFLFRLEHVWPNLQRYPLWLLQTETPIVLVAVLTPWLTGDSSTRRRVIWLLAFIAAVFACYIPYSVFDAWWFLRFVLPAYPALLVLTATALVWLFDRIAWQWRVLMYAAVVAVAVVMLRDGIQRHVFGLWQFERRFQLAGDYVAARLPTNAIIITGQESGSVRFYADRDTMVWRALPPDALDTAITFARARGYRPYLLIETEEQQEFVDRFDARSPLGGLGWPPLVDINHMLRIYDPEDCSRYRAGERITTERVWTKRERVLARFK
jgi:dolichyl-phosphate-mannose-protein mannosyltransferase